MKNNNARPRVLTRRNALFIIFALSIASAIVVVPVYSARSVLAGKSSRLGEPASSAASRLTSSLKRSGRASVMSPFGLSQPASETIATFAADCTTARTTFYVGETVCAKTDSVAPLDGSWWVNWILLNPSTVVSGGDHVFPVTTNPQTFTYAPTAVGSYKVSLSNVEGDPSQTPAGFTVVATPTLATYSGNCSMAQTDFNLNQTVCVKVSGLSNDVFPDRRVQITSPDGFALNRVDVTDNSMQTTYQFPNTASETVGSTTINHVGTWTVSLIDEEANINNSVSVVVHSLDRITVPYADLQLAKVSLGDPVEAGQNVSFEVFVFNAGPDPATSITFNDFTLPDTSFFSFTRNAILIGSNQLPSDDFTGRLTADNYVSLSDPRFKALNDLRYQPFGGAGAFPLTMMSDSPVTFTCTTPSVGSAGTTTCTTPANQPFMPGDTASFPAVYTVSSSIPNGASLSDPNAANITSGATDPQPTSNTTQVDTTAANSTPSSCSLSCPGNMTVTANTTGPGLDSNGDPATVPGANVTFSATSSGSCGTITSSPASGSFIPLGTTPVTISESTGASCDF